MGLFRRKGRSAEGAQAQDERIADPVQNGEGFARALNAHHEGGGDPFDFSMDSIAGLDRFLAQMAQEGRPLQWGTEVGAACYLAECMRRTYGGEYLLGPDPKTDPLVLVFQGDGFQVGALYFHRIRDRYEGGPEEDLLFFADGYPAAISQGRDATVV